jgi:hypothetical protein
MLQKTIYQFIMSGLLFWIRPNLCVPIPSDFVFVLDVHDAGPSILYHFFYIIHVVSYLVQAHNVTYFLLLPCVVKSPDAEHFIQSSLSVRPNFTFQSTSQPKKLGNRPRGSWPAWSYHRLFPRPSMSNPLRLFLVKARVPVRWSIGVATNMIEAKQFWEWCVAYDS